MKNSALLDRASGVDDALPPGRSWGESTGTSWRPLTEGLCEVGALALVCMDRLRPVVHSQEHEWAPTHHAAHQWQGDLSS